MKLSEKASQIQPSSTLAITAKAKQMAAEGHDVIGFGAGEPDFDTPQHIKEAAIAAINAGFTKYTPAGGIIPLKQAICDKLKKDNNLDYKPNQIVVSNGAKHSLTNAFMAILNPGDEVLVPAPYWLSYPEMIKLADGKSVFITAKKENGYKVTVEELKAHLTDKTRALLINSPSNPTGMIYSETELRAIADFAIENDLYVVSDEIYEKLIYDGETHVSIASFNQAIYDRTIVVNGVSKSYAMTGWRIGYTASSVQIASIMDNVQSHQSSNPNSIAQKATIAAIEGPQDCIAEMTEQFDARRVYMYDRLASMPLIDPIKPQGAFYVFIDLADAIGKSYKDVTITDAAKFSELIIAHEGVAVVPCADFGYPNHIRLSYAISMKDIENGLNRIQRFLEETK